MRLLTHILLAALLVTAADAQQPRAVQASTAAASRDQITADFKVGTGRTVSFLAGSTLDIDGVFSGSPTGGTLDLSLLSLTLPEAIRVPSAVGQSGKFLSSNGTTWVASTAGSGTGDLVAANNLSDVANTATALSNLGGAALSGAAFTGGVTSTLGFGVGASASNNVPFRAEQSINDNYGLVVTNSSTGVYGSAFLSIASDIGSSAIYQRSAAHYQSPGKFEVITHASSTGINLKPGGTLAATFQTDGNVLFPGNVLTEGIRAGTVVWASTYGTIADGVTDDRLAIQAAIDAVSGMGGGIVLLPTGTLAVSRNTTTNAGLSVPSNVTLAGQGMGATTLLYTDAVSVTSSVVTTPSGGGDQATQDAGDANVHLRDFKIQFANRVAGKGNGVCFGGVTGGSITRVWVDNAGGYGIWLVRNNDKTGPDAEGKVTEFVTVSDCRVSRFLDVGIELSGAVNCAVTNCVISGDGNTSVTVLGAAIEIWNGSQWNVVSNCTIRGDSGSSRVTAFRMDPYADANTAVRKTAFNLITGCVAYNVQHGFRSFTNNSARTEDSEIVNCRAYGMGTAGGVGALLVAMNRVRLRGCTFENFDYTLRVSAPGDIANQLTVNDLTVTDCTLGTYDGGTGAELYGVTGLDFSGNRLTQGYSFGVKFYGCQDVQANHNRGYNIGQTGVDANNAPLLFFAKCSGSSTRESLNINASGNRIYDDRATKWLNWCVLLGDATDEVIAAGNNASAGKVGASAVTNAGTGTKVTSFGNFNSGYSGGFSTVGATTLSSDLTGVLKATAGTISSATAGSDYLSTIPSALTGVNSVTSASGQNLTLTTNGGSFVQVAGGKLLLDTATPGTISSSGAGQPIIFEVNGTEAARVTSSGLSTGGTVTAGSGPTTITDSAGKILSAALNTVEVGQGGTSHTSYTNGQLLIGNTTSGGLDKATLTAGTGITITNGAGSITINSTASGGGTKTLFTFTASQLQPPASNFFTFDTRGGILVAEFDDGADAGTADENGIVIARVPEGATLSSGVTVYLEWMADSATSGSVVWQTEFARFNADNIDFDSITWDTATTATSAANTTAAGRITKATITVAEADTDGIAAGDMFALRITRKETNGSDTMSGDAQLIGGEIRGAN